MYFCINESKNNTPVFQGELIGFYPHTSASEAANCPVMGISFGNSVKVSNPELFKLFCDLHAVHMRNSIKNPENIAELWFKLPNLRGDWNWGIWQTGYVD